MASAVSHSSTRYRPLIALLLAGCVLPAAACAHGVPPREASAVSGTVTDADRATEQAPVRDWRWSSLESLIEAASLVPDQGVYARERSRMLESIGEAYISIGDPGTAVALAREITDWQGAALTTEAALEFARRGDADEARRLTRIALAKLSGFRDWQQERVRVLAAQVHAWLGDRDEASRLEEGVGEPDQGVVAAALAEKQAKTAFSPADFDAQMESLEQWIATRNFDLVRNAVEVALEFYPACFGDAPRRARVESLVAAANEQIAYDLRIRHLVRMAVVAAGKSDAAAARAFIAQAESALASARWLLEDELVQVAVVCEAKARIGDRDAAKADLARALGRYESGRLGIVDVFRGPPLRALAEAYAAAGDSAKAREVFSRALEEGTINPNARPRTTDLVATGVSMVRAGVEPDAPMRETMQAIREGLVAPW